MIERGQPQPAGRRAGAGPLHRAAGGGGVVYVGAMSQRRHASSAPRVRAPRRTATGSTSPPSDAAQLFLDGDGERYLRAGRRLPGRRPARATAATSA